MIITLIGVVVGGVLLGLLQVIPSPDQSPSGGAVGAPSPAAFLLFVTIPVLLIAGGATVLGVASVRANVFPQGASLLLVAAGIIGLVSLVVPSPIASPLEVLWNGIFFIAVTWFGAALITHSRADALAPSAA